MCRSSVISILKRYRHALEFHNMYNSFTFSASRALLFHNCPTFGSHKILSAQIHLSWNEHSVFATPLRNFSSEKVVNDAMDEDCNRHDLKDGKSLYNANAMYLTIMENGSGNGMEKALEHMGVLLTTDLVIEMLHRLRFEEKIAFRFFMWAGQQEHYQHEYQVYNEMIDILSSTKFKLKQFRIICDMLDYLKRNDKKSVPIDVLLNILKNYTEKHLTKVKKCSRRKKRIRVEMQPKVIALNLLLEALCKCFLVETAEIIFRKVKNKIEPDVNTFNILFFGWCRIRNPTKGMRILEEMTNVGFIADNFTYNAAIDSFCREGMLNEAYALFKFMKTKDSVSSPTAKTYIIMILALVKGYREEVSFRVVADMIQSGCLPDVSHFKELIQGMCLAGKVDMAYRFLEEMARKGFPTDIVTYNCFLKVLCDNKMASEALRHYGKMIELGCLPSVHTFNMLIEMFFAMGEPDGAFETWYEMDKRGCNRDTNTYCLMIEGLFGCNRIDDACFLLEEVVNKGMKLPYQKFDLFLMHLSATGNLRAIHTLSEHMRMFYNSGMARRFALSQKRKSLSLRGD